MVQPAESGLRKSETGMKCCDVKTPHLLRYAQICCTNLTLPVAQRQVLLILKSNEHMFFCRQLKATGLMSARGIYTVMAHTAEGRNTTCC